MTGALPARLAALHARCFERPRPWSAAEFAGLLGDPQVHLLDRTTGFLIGRIVLDEAELLTLAVDPPVRRQGLARALLEDWHDRARQAGAALCFLEVAEDNAPARALYGAAGYVAAGRRRGYYRSAAGAPLDALLLRRPLAPRGADLPEGA